MIPKRERPVMVRLDEELFAALKSQADREERTVAAQVRLYIKQALEQAA